MPVESSIHKFRVSAALKDLIGRDLITNDFVAIFELVKNSFDAQATYVDIAFLEDRILLIDDGKGMTLSDIENKWLFVAYSAKKHRVEDSQNDLDYRQKIKKGVSYAGSKGIGRFSCDRLGRRLHLQTKSERSNDVLIVDVEWKLFEKDDEQEFVNVPIEISSQPNFSHLSNFTVPITGTVLDVTDLREAWDRKKLLSLKSHLAKLISPYEGRKTFGVALHSPVQIEQDEKVRSRQRSGVTTAEDIEKVVAHQVVNGTVQNFVFEELPERTTYISIRIDDSTDSIISSLIDRGQLIFKISEANPYSQLSGTNFSCDLYYLNQAAKNLFTRRVGVPAVQFGSVFLFKNGFRVFPIGEEGDDTFQIDRRKQQGYARYLGTREIIGRIDVEGTDEQFKEATSRDQGLIQTKAYEELEECFREHCLKRLERYVVNVSWVDKLDKDTIDTSRISTPLARARIAEVVSTIVASPQIELVEYSSDLQKMLVDRLDQAEPALANLRKLADKTNDEYLSNQVGKAQKRHLELRLAEEKAREQAETERKAREQAEAGRKQAEGAYEEEKKRNLFLTSVTSLDSEAIIEMHHQIGIYAAEIAVLVDGVVDDAKKILKQGDELDRMTGKLERISFRNDQMLTISRLATRANFRMASEEIEADLIAYIRDYTSNISSLYEDQVDIILHGDDKEFERRFKPIEVAIIIDNLVTNSRKAHASLLRLDFEVKGKVLEIIVEDNGDGLNETIAEADRIFERGYSTTNGSGLGLTHVRKSIDDMKGSISVDGEHEEGLRIHIKIPK